MIYITNKKEDDNYYPILGGKHISKWNYHNPKLFVNYGKYLACPRSKSIFEQPKILIREAGSKIIATYDDNNFYIMSSLYNAIIKDRAYSLKYLLCLINSQLYQYLMNLFTFDKTKGAFTKAKIFHYHELPIKKIDNNDQQPFIEKADLMLKLNKELYEKKDKFFKLIKNRFNLEKISKKLDKFYKLDFNEFKKQLKIKKIKLEEESELIDFFEKNKQELSNLKTKIDEEDKIIDNMVFDLYGLNEEEKNIVLNG